MPKIDNQTFYKNAFKKYGRTPKGLNWSSELSQSVRFEKIVEFLEPLLSDSDIIVDAGCGFGDLYHYLLSKDLNFLYIGYDVVDEFIDIAKENTKQNILKKDILTDTLKEADFYVASGSLNILNEFETYLFIQRCFTHSKKAFIFNMLEGSHHTTYNLVKKEKIIEYGKELGAKVSLKEGYFMQDFTICFVKPPL